MSGRRRTYAALYPKHRLFRVVLRHDIVTYACAPDAHAAAQLALVGEREQDGVEWTIAGVSRASREDIPSSDGDVLPWCSDPKCLLCDTDCSVGEWHDEQEIEKFKRTLTREAASIVSSVPELRPQTLGILHDAAVLDSAVSDNWDDDERREESSRIARALAEIAHRLAVLGVEPA